MDSRNYYSTEQLAAATQKLLQQGKPMFAIAIDPKCPPDVAAKMLELEKVWKKQEGGKP